MDGPQSNPHQQIRFPLDLASIQILKQALGPFGASTPINGRVSYSTFFSLSGTTKAVWDTVDYANGITWNGGSNRFVCLTAGQYSVSATLWYGHPAFSSPEYDYFIYIYKNGSLHSSFETTFENHGALGSSSISITDDLNLAVNDYVEIFTASSYSATALAVGNDSTVQFFSIKKI